MPENKFSKLKISADGTSKKVSLPVNGIFTEKADNGGVMALRIPRPFITQSVLETALTALDLSKDEKDLIDMMIVNCQSRPDGSYHTYRSTDEAIAPLYNEMKKLCASINTKYRNLKDKSVFKTTIMTQEQYDQWIANAQAKRGNYL